MKLTVDFWKLEDAGPAKVGELRWDGKKITATNDRLNQVAKQPIRPYPPVHAGQIEIIHRDEEPEKFMRALCRTYKSPYFCAHKATID